MSEQSWSVLSVLRWSAQFLKDKGLAEPKADADFLMMHILKLPRIELYLQFERPLSVTERKAYKALLLRRAKHEPLQYIVGSAPFFGHEYMVDRRVLIPRFDTEILVETVLTQAQKHTGPLTIIDVGTGSGCIAIALKLALPDAHLIGVDISPEALAVATENAARLGVTIDWRQSDLLNGLIHDTFAHDVFIVSNPPYIAQHEYALLDQEVRDYEPASALFAEDDGLACYQQLMRQASVFDHCVGIFFEVGFTQAASVKNLIQSRFPSDVQVVKDLGGKERVVYTVMDSLAIGGK